VIAPRFLEVSNSINGIPKLAKEAFHEAASVHRFDYRLHHVSKISSELL